MSLAVGIDISKKKLEFCMGNSYAQIGNNKKDIISFFKDKPKDSPIVMEATGKYHRLAHQSLEGMGFLVMVVNPYQSKNFAKAPRTNRAHAIHEGSTHRDHPGQVGRTPSMRALRIAVTPDKSGARHP